MKIMVAGAMWSIKGGCTWINDEELTDSLYNANDITCILFGIHKKQKIWELLSRLLDVNNG